MTKSIVYHINPGGIKKNGAKKKKKDVCNGCMTIIFILIMFFLIQDLQKGLHAQIHTI